VTRGPTPGSGDIDPQVVCPSSTSSASDAGEAQVLRPPRCSIVPSSAHCHHLRDRASWSRRRRKSWTAVARTKVPNGPLA
jgi:hypothetical protein